MIRRLAYKYRYWYGDEWGFDEVFTGATRHYQEDLAHLKMLARKKGAEALSVKPRDVLVEVVEVYCE